MPRPDSRGCCPPVGATTDDQMRASADAVPMPLALTRPDFCTRGSLKPPSSVTRLRKSAAGGEETHRVLVGGEDLRHPQADRIVLG